MSSRRRSRPVRAPRSGWRGTIASFGGFSTISGVAAIVLVVAGLIYVSLPDSSGPAGGDFEPRLRAEVRGRVVGSASAPVRVVEYGDYQCPFCRDFWRDTEAALYTEFIATGQVSFEFRDLVVVGPESTTAAEGAACAAQQDFFWPVHDVLYQRQGGRENAGVYSADNVKRFAREAAEATGASVDLDAFNRCVDKREQRGAVDAMNAEARAAGVRSTPTFLINGRMLTGAASLETLRTAIRQAMPR